MKPEQQNCCLCFGIASEGNVIDSEILELLKFLIVNVDTSVFENSTVCDDCLNKIIETCQYKRRNSSKMLMEPKKEMDSETSIICQKCEKVCEQGDIFSLMDCVTQIDWSDFVNYLFVSQDSSLLESSQICDSCRISVSSIQNFLKLIYVYDQGKMKCEIDDIKPTGNILVDVKKEIKKEFGNFTVDDKTQIENITEDTKIEIGDSDYSSGYADFKCKNEEVDLKLEFGDSQSTDRREKVDVEEMISSGTSNNRSSNEEEELGVNSQGCSNRLRYELKVHINRQFKCIYCTKGFVKKYGLDNHILRIHKCRDGVSSKIHDCDKCSYMTTIKSSMLRHTVKHDQIKKNSLIKHIKMHNIRNFKCTLCFKNVNRKNYLDCHLLRVHKSKDNITSKIHKCDRCSYVTINKDKLLKHKLKHGIKVEGIKKYKCQDCIYETHYKDNLIRHIKTHNNIRDVKCTLCSRDFTTKKYLDDHLLKVHKSKDDVTSKIHECDKCNYETTKKTNFVET